MKYTIILLLFSCALWGQTDSIHKTYYESGKLSSETPYINGKINGVAKTYYENGKLQIETPYANGYQSGAYKEYDENGKLIQSK